MIMTSKKRRQIMNEIGEYMRKDGVFCSCCRVQFPHLGKTYGGLTRAGVVALVGKCCRSELKVIITGGVYLLVGTREWAEAVADRVVH